MQSKLLCAVIVCCALACAEPPPDPELARAQAEIEQLRALVGAGAAPRLKLQRAEEALADARDEAFLRHTLYGQDLTENQAGAMIAAAERRLERRRVTLAAAEKLVEEGVAPRLSLGEAVAALDRARREYDLAVSRAKLVEELAAMARAEQAAQEQPAMPPVSATAEKYEGNGVFTPGDFERVMLAYEGEFLRPLPISARGETAVHRALGFDHRDRIDVALNPDQPEGIWLRRYLESNHIPYFAFRRSVPGKATAAHIHIGPASGRLAKRG